MNFCLVTPGISPTMKVMLRNMEKKSFLHWYALLSGKRRYIIVKFFGSLVLSALLYECKNRLYKKLLENSAPFKKNLYSFLMYVKTVHQTSKALKQH